MDGDSGRGFGVPCFPTVCTSSIAAYFFSVGRGWVWGSLLGVWGRGEEEDGGVGSHVWKRGSLRFGRCFWLIAGNLYITSLGIYIMPIK